MVIAIVLTDVLLLLTWAWVYVYLKKIGAVNWNLVHDSLNKVDNPAQPKEYKDMITIDYLGKGQGKSIRICYLSEIFKADIVVATKEMQEHIKIEAKTLGIAIKNVYCFDEFQSACNFGQDIVVDEWDFLTLEQQTFLATNTNVIAVSKNSTIIAKEDVTN